MRNQSWLFLYMKLRSVRTYTTGAAVMHVGEASNLVAVSREIHQP
jgi:uncharacterized membrane protein